MQTTNLPLSICDEIDKRIRGFLWGASTQEHRHLHLVNWQEVSQQIYAGGLGFKTMRHMNHVSGSTSIDLKFDLEALWFRLPKGKVSY